jgi:hypothetical protein
MYCSFASNGHADMMCSTVSANCLQSLRLLSVSFVIFLSHDIPRVTFIIIWLKQVYQNIIRDVLLLLLLLLLLV